MIGRLQNAIKIYSKIDQQVNPKTKMPLTQSLSREKQEKLAAHIEAISDFGYILGENLAIHEAIRSYTGYKPSLLNECLDQAKEILTGSSEINNVLSTLEALGLDLAKRSTLFLGIKELGEAVNEIDWNKIENTILVASIAFSNNCPHLCPYCANAGKWDRRTSTLEEFREWLPKIRFPLNLPVSLSYNEPFTTPFLTDIVKMMIEHGAKKVRIITSASGGPETIIDDLLKTAEQYPNKIEVGLSLDPSHPLSLEEAKRVLIKLNPIFRGLLLHSLERNRVQTVLFLTKLMEGLGEEMKATQKSIGKQIQTLIKRPKEGRIFPSGNAIKLLLENGEFEYNLFRTINSYFWLETPFSPYMMPSMLFAGGDIVPFCSSLSALIRTNGNITMSPQQIRKMQSSFAKDYRQIRIQGFLSHPAVLLTEAKRRETIDGPWPMFTNYHLLAEQVGIENRPASSASKLRDLILRVDRHFIQD
ncbi:MAG: hypothetical protein HQ564_00345 [Candidatus Saganbacteria bacterium]|nr:hypothetical protein [Candidatus Saganbacteria bacterium]